MFYWLTSNISLRYRYRISLFNRYYFCRFQKMFSCRIVKSKSGSKIGEWSGKKKDEKKRFATLFRMINYIKLLTATHWEPFIRPDLHITGCKPTTRAPPLQSLLRPQLTHLITPTIIFLLTPPQVWWGKFHLRCPITTHMAQQFPGLKDIIVAQWRQQRTFFPRGNTLTLMRECLEKREQRLYH